MSNNEKKGTRKEIAVTIAIWALGISGILLMLFALTSVFWIAPILADKEHIEKLGTAGDYLGGSTTPFLNTASVLLVLATIIMQGRALRVQREETKATQEEVHEQVKTMKVQRFDNTFLI